MIVAFRNIQDSFGHSVILSWVASKCIEDFWKAVSRMILSQILCFERWFAGQLQPHGSMDLCFHAWTHPLRPGGLFRWCRDDNFDATLWHTCATVCHCATEEMEAYRLYTVVPRLVSKTQVMWATRKSTNLILVTLILKLPKAARVLANTHVSLWGIFWMIWRTGWGHSFPVIVYGVW